MISQQIPQQISQTSGNNADKPRNEERKLVIGAKRAHNQQQRNRRERQSGLLDEHNPAEDKIAVPYEEVAELVHSFPYGCEKSP
jgi:hypothetical protein